MRATIDVILKVFEENGIEEQQEIESVDSIQFMKLIIELEEALEIVFPNEILTQDIFRLKVEEIAEIVIAIKNKSE